MSSGAPEKRQQGARSSSIADNFATKDQAQGAPMRRVTLTQYLIEQQRQYGKVSPELRLLIEVIARACKAISHTVSKGPLAGIGDAVGLDNVQGEAQKKLDVIANEVLVEANEWGGQLAAMVSEEMAEPTRFRTAIPKASSCSFTTRSTAPPISTSTFQSGRYFRCCGVPATARTSITKP